MPISSHSHSLFLPETGIHFSVLCLCGFDGSGHFLEIESAHIWLFVPVFFRLVASLHGVSPYQLSTTPYGHLIGCSVIPPILLIHSSLEERLFGKHFGYFHFLALINNAGMSTHVQQLYCSKWMYFQLEVWLFVFSYLFHFILLYLAPTFLYGCEMSKYKRKHSLKLCFHAYMRYNHSKLYLHSFRKTFWAHTHMCQSYE